MKILFTTIAIMIFISFSTNSLAKRDFSEISSKEYLEYGYKSEQEFMAHFTKCAVIQNEIKSSENCHDFSCVQKNVKWIYADCDKSSVATYFLLFRPDLPERSMLNMSDKKIKKYSSGFLSTCMGNPQEQSKTYRFPEHKIEEFCNCSLLESFKFVSVEEVSGRGIDEDFFFKVDYFKNLCAHRINKY